MYVYFLGLKIFLGVGNGGDVESGGEAALGCSCRKKRKEGSRVKWATVKKSARNFKAERTVFLQWSGQEGRC